MMFIRVWSFETEYSSSYVATEINLPNVLLILVLYKTKRTKLEHVKFG